MKKKLIVFLLALTFGLQIQVKAQLNTDRVMLIGRNALYYEDYILAIQYFNQVINTKPYLAEPYYFRAIAKYFLEDIKGAEEDCSACLERNPFITNAYQLRGDTRQRLENFDGARADYMYALKEMPGNKFLLVNLGIVNIERKAYDEAKSNIDELIKTYPTYNAAYMTMAALHLEMKDTVKAFEDYDKAIAVDKFFAQSYSLRGMLYFQKKNYDKAYKDLDEAIKLDPLVSGNYINRGLIRYYKNDLRGAMADYDKVIEMEPNSLIARFNRALLRAQVGDDNRAIEDFNVVIEKEPENYMAYYNRAILKNSISDFRGAIRDLNVVMAEYPDYPQGFYFRAELKKRLGDQKGSEKDFLYARNLEQINQRKLATKAGREAFQKKEKEKEKDLEKTRENSNKDIDKFDLLVVADKEEQQKSKFTSEIRGRVQDRQVKIQLQPKFVISYYESSSETKRFVYYSPLLDEINSNPVFQRKLRLTNNESPLLEAQIDTHFKLIDEYSKLIKNQPNNALAYFARGMEYLMVQDFANSADDFKKTIQFDNKFTLAYFNLAVVINKELDLRNSGPEYEALSTRSKSPALSATGANPAKADPLINPIVNQNKLDYEQIISNYTRAISLSPNFEYAYYNRAEIKASQKDYPAAIADYDEVIKLDPELAEAYFNRGLCHLSVQETEKGLDDLRRAGELGIVDAYSIIKRMTSK
jgi:tetratricopeptide (TPR) repeat protein